MPELPLTYRGCVRKGCEGRPAIWQPSICFGPVGYPREEKYTVRAMLGVAFCDEDKEEWSGEFLREFIKLNGDRLRADFAALGKAPPDLENAWLEWSHVAGAKA